MNYRIIAALLLLSTAYLTPGIATADQNDPLLPSLFDALRLARSEAEAEPYVTEIWRRWSYVENHAASIRLLRGVAQMEAGDLSAAISEFDVLVEMALEFAEGWNRRATVDYMVGNFARSVLDIQRTLALEPRHFGALSGLAMIYQEIGKDKAALPILEKVRDINPNAPSIDEQIKALREQIQGQRT